MSKIGFQIIGKLNRAVECKVPIRAMGGMDWEVTIPAGLRCCMLTGPQGSRWVLDEFPDSVFKGRGMQKHDAEYYGITVPDDAIDADYRDAQYLQSFSKYNDGNPV